MRLHQVEAVNIPLEELHERSAELPPKRVRLIVYDAIETRAQAAAERLRVAGRAVGEVRFGIRWLAEHPTCSGESPLRLWRPNALLQEAVVMAEASWGTLRGRSALDVACGAGRDVVFLAERGLITCGCDVLPDALQRCRDLARRNGVTVETRQADLRHWRPAASSYDLVSCFRFLHRPLMPHLAAAVRRGGYFVCQTFLRPTDQSTTVKPLKGRFLEPGEMRSWTEGWEVLVYREDRDEEDRLTAGLIARRPTGDEAAK